MRKLASNDKAMLVKCGREYWVVVKKEETQRCPNGWDTSVYNEQSDNYRAKDALTHFTEDYGPPTWTHENIGHY